MQVCRLHCKDVLHPAAQSQIAAMSCVVWALVFGQSNNLDDSDNGSSPLLHTHVKLQICVAAGLCWKREMCLPNPICEKIVA